MLEKFLELTGDPVPKGIVHVGAHHGQEIKEYQPYGPGVLIWIEADPDLYAELHQYLSQYPMPGTSQWCLNAMVSDSDGEFRDFHIASNQGQSSSMFPSTDLLRRNYPQAVPTGKVLQLQTRTLQSLLSGVGVVPEQIDYLVLDTQGAEMKCLLGAGPYLNHLRFIVAEISTVELYSGGAKMQELDDYLEARNFLRVSGDPDYGHGNALYLRVSRAPDHFKDTSGGFDETRDIAMRELANTIIGQFNSAESKPDGQRNLEGDVLALYQNYEDILGLPHNRDVSITMTRMTFNRDMKEAFQAFLRLL